jgi:hypothetical protein
MQIKFNKKLRCKNKIYKLKALIEKNKIKHKEINFFQSIQIYKNQAQKISK